MAQRRLAHGALEGEHLVGQVDRVAVQEVHFQLRRARLVDQRVEIQLLLLAEAIHVLDDRVELVGRVDRVGLPGGLGPARAADRRFELVVGIDVLLDEVELHLGRHHRLQAIFLVESQYAPQHAARGERVQVAFHVVAVVDDLRGRLIRPGDEAHRIGVGAQVHVAVAGVEQFPVIIRVIAVHRLGEDALGQARIVLPDELVRGDEFPARVARHVGDQHLHFRDAVVEKPLVDDIHGCHLLLPGEVSDIAPPHGNPRLKADAFTVSGTVAQGYKPN